MDEGESFKREGAEHIATDLVACRLWSLKDAMSLLDIKSRDEMWRLRKTGQLVTVIRGKRRLITGTSLAAFANSHPIESPEST